MARLGTVMYALRYHHGFLYLEPVNPHAHEEVHDKEVENPVQGIVEPFIARALRYMVRSGFIGSCAEC
jgi:hypothetical protein